MADLFIRTNSLLYDFLNVDSNILSKLLNTYCMSIYSSQLWKFTCFSSVEKIHIAWKKTVRIIRKINSRTHNVLINKINRCAPIDVSHASDLFKSKLCIKFIWSLCNCKYALYKRIVKMFLTNVYSTIDEHIKFFMCISLFNSINKLFDYIIIDLCGDTLSTSDMHFGYKPNHSTTSCTTVLKNIIQYYLRENNDNHNENVLFSHQT